MISDVYEIQVDLLLEVLPIVARHPEFAIKGGTALNLFCLDMPRLSVDIDLCYLPIKDRTDSYSDIHRILGQMKDQIERIFGFKVQSNHPLDGKREARIVVATGSAAIKIEPNYVLRGSLFDPLTMEISKVAQARFEKNATALILDQSDLYGGKFCAALDRQHPRDLFDVTQYFLRNTINSQVKDAFIFYLLSHNRPMHELLDARELNIAEIYESDFLGMTDREIPISDLTQARKKLKVELLSAFDDRDRRFLTTFTSNAPDWSCFNQPKIRDFPSIRWKLYNLGKLSKKKRDEQTKLLADILT